jgi:putative drug exporter of the RND superfamily
MATYLYRLGRFAFRQRKLVAALWVALLVAAIAGAVGLSGHTTSSFSITGKE